MIGPDCKGLIILLDKNSENHCLIGPRRIFSRLRSPRLLLVSSLAIFGVTPVLSKPLPTGFFELRRSTDTIKDVTKTAGWLRPDVAGIAIRLDWNVIQPTSSTVYDWTYIDAVAALTVQDANQFCIPVGGGAT